MSTQLQAEKENSNPKGLEVRYAMKVPDDVCLML